MCTIAGTIVRRLIRKNCMFPLHILKTMICIEACRVAELDVHAHVDEYVECGHIKVPIV